MQYLVRVGLLVLVVMAWGCASKTTVNYVPPKETEKANTRVFNASLDKTWNAAIKSIGENFYVLDNIQKDSKIITLSYSASNPVDYIDCGNLTYTTSMGMSGRGTTTFPAAAQSTEFNHAVSGNPHPATFIRRTKLDGKANIIFAEEGTNSTRVTVNSRYILTINTKGTHPAYLAPSTDVSSIVFSTGQIGTHDGGGQTQCATKYTLEKQILDGIGSKLY